MNTSPVCPPKKKTCVGKTYSSRNVDYLYKYHVKGGEITYIFSLGTFFFFYIFFFSRNTFERFPAVNRSCQCPGAFVFSPSEAPPQTTFRRKTLPYSDMYQSLGNHRDEALAVLDTSEHLHLHHHMTRRRAKPSNFEIRGE